MSKSLRFLMALFVPIVFLLGACAAAPAGDPAASADATTDTTAATVVEVTTEPVAPTATPEPEPTATPEPEPEIQTTPSDEGVLLKVQWPTDAPLHMRMVMTQTSEQEMMGQQISTEQVLSYHYLYVPLDVSEGGDTTIWVSIEGMAMEMAVNTTGMTETLRIDTDDPTTLAGEGQIFAGMVGQGYEIVMNSQGKVIAINGLGEMIDGIMARANPENDPAVAQSLQMFLGGFTEEGLANNFASMMPVYPAEPISIGDGWTHVMTMTAPLPMVITSQFEMVDRQDGMVTFDLFGDIEVSSEPMGQEGLDMRLILTGYQSGMARVEESSGLTLYSETSMEMDGFIEFEADGETISIPMSSTSITTLEMYR